VEQRRLIVAGREAAAATVLVRSVNHFGFLHA
jgi:hypothetical protein